MSLPYDFRASQIGLYIRYMLLPFLEELFANQQYDEKKNFLIAGPCVVENEDVLMEVGGKVHSVCKRLGIPYIFKSSYRKAL